MPLRSVLPSGALPRGVLFALLALATALPGTAALLRAPVAAGAPFSLASFTTSATSSQAGAHPDVTAAFALSTDALGDPLGQLRSATVTLPPGLGGEAASQPRCSQEAFQELRCPAASQVGVLEASFAVCQGVRTELTAEAPAGASTVTLASTAGLCASDPDETVTIGAGAGAETVQIAYVLDERTLALKAPLQRAHPAGEEVLHLARPVTVPIPLFDLTPTPGHVATLGASVLLASVLVQVDLTQDGRLVAQIGEVSTLLSLLGARLTLWGMPGNASHDAQRCDQLGSGCGAPGGSAGPFLSNPTACGAEPLATQLTVSSWEGQSDSAASTLAPIAGCETLALSAGLRVTPTTTRRDTPAGYAIDLTVAQDGEPGAPAAPDLRTVAVTLPPGTSLSPGFAQGLVACSDQQFAAGACPHAAAVGTATFASPLLTERLPGTLYLATPTSAQPYRLFLQAGGGSVTIRLHGRIEASPTTGQVTAVFEELPQLQLSELELNLFGGPTAALANPASCGPAGSVARLTTYAGKSAEPSFTFTVDADGAGGPCPASPTFAPTFGAGTTASQAAALSAFQLGLGRADGEPDFAGFSVRLPPGLMGMLGALVPCPRLQAETGDCPPGAKIGSATVLAGAGSLPLRLTAPVYLAGPYQGAPFSLTASVDASVGPFHLGTLTVGARILVDPASLALTVVSDPLPQILAGVPLRLRAIALALDRPGLIRNPADCAARPITATVTGSEGARAAPSAPFRVQGCARLRFAPRLTAATTAHASESATGAGLRVTLADPTPGGATIGSAIVELPGALRPRLSALQNACLLTLAGSDPSACPASARMGLATVSTPMLPVALSGGVYLVTHGGLELPSLALLLRGEGVTVELTGGLAISAQGRLSVAFQTLPDIPIRSLTLELPRGWGSLLGAAASPCARPLWLPYRLTDRIGRQIKATARVAVAGCPRHLRRRRHRSRGAAGAKGAKARGA